MKDGLSNLPQWFVLSLFLFLYSRIKQVKILGFFIQQTVAVHLHIPAHLPMTVVPKVLALVATVSNQKRRLPLGG